MTDIRKRSPVERVFTLARRENTEDYSNITPQTSKPVEYSVQCNLSVGSDEFSTIDALRCILKQTRADKNILKKDNDELVKENERLINQACDQNAENWDLIDQVDKLKVHHNFLTGELEDSDTKLSTILTENKHIRQDVENTKKMYAVANSASMDLANKCNELRKDLGSTRNELVDAQTSNEPQSEYWSGKWFDDFNSRLHHTSKVVGECKNIIDVQQKIIMNFADSMKAMKLKIESLEERNEKNDAAIILQSVAKGFINKKDREEGWQVTDADF